MHCGTEAALVQVTNDILIALDSGLASVLVLLDLRAAFDAIDHHILLERQEHLIGNKGATLSSFQSYLSGQFHFVHVNNESSPCMQKLNTQFQQCLLQHFDPFYKPYLCLNILRIL